jgi:hypothetical protein
MYRCTFRLHFPPAFCECFIITDCFLMRRVLVVAQPVGTLFIVFFYAVKLCIVVGSCQRSGGK